jgi:regulatory protein
VRNDVTRGANDKPARSLKARAIAHLARREHSRAELAQRLLAAGAARADVDKTLAEIAAEGYLSDERYAQALVRQKSATMSRRALAEALKTKGVTDEVARRALANVETDDGATLVALWRRRFGHAPKDDRERARQVRFLQSRGFALSAIITLLRAPPSDD